MIKLIFRSNIDLNSACRQKEEHMLGRACCTNWQDTFIQTNMDVIARWVRVITLAKGRHFLNLLVLHRFRVSSKSYKLAPRIGTRVQCLSNDPSVAFSHSFTSSSASHVVAYEIRQAGYPLSASLSATIFPLKSPLRNQDLFERMFCLSDRCFSATWQHFPQVREAPSFVANE